MEPVRFNSTDTQPVLGTTVNTIEFDVPAIRKLVTDMGLEVLWEKSYLCTCRNSGMTGAPDTSCPICKGRGIAYLPATTVKVAIQSQDRGVTNSDLGLYDSGTAIGTTLPESRITFRDRLSIPDVEIDQSMIFDVTQKRIDKGMWLSYDVKEITLAVTNGGKNIYIDEDYTIDIEKNLFFPRAHLLGKNVSLNIVTTLRYIVIDLLKESRYQYTDKGKDMERFQALPKKLLLKREDAWVNPTPFSLNDDEYVTPEIPEDPKRVMNTGGGFFGGVI